MPINLPAGVKAVADTTLIGSISVGEALLYTGAGLLIFAGVRWAAGNLFKK